MAKSKETFLKVAKTFKTKGDKLWAKAKDAESNGDNVGTLFQQARDAYSTAEKAEESARNS